MLTFLGKNGKMKLSGESSYNLKIREKTFFKSNLVSRPRPGILRIGMVGT